nr:transketolase [Rhodospirillales bacterium]
MSDAKAPDVSASSVDPAIQKRMANAIRFLAMDAVEKAKSGHPGMPMGAADMATVLFSQFLKFDPNDPAWPDRDRFVLSAGHGSMLLYSLLHLTGYKDMTLDELKNFRQFESRTAGHPEYGVAPGIETTTGPLGQGLANAVGMALAERHMAARSGDDLVDHHTYAIVGDGCLMEGISHEAASLAGHLRLSKLVVLWDDNKICIDGPTSLTVSEDTLKRFDAYGWDVCSVDGHDPEAIRAAIAAARVSDRPSLISARTTIGFGAPTKGGTSATHGAHLGAEEIAGARKALDWPHAPFEIPEDVRAAWKAVGARGGAARDAWSKRLDAQPADQREAFEAALSGDMPKEFDGVVDDYIATLIKDAPAWATRKSSQEALEVMTAAVPGMLGGSADLTGSNNTKTKVEDVLDADHYGGRYIYYGVREHGMASVMNGMALHGGIIPYGGTFLIFTDYCRPAIRLSALMGLRVIYVMTHDSIGLGEDGPTHQPVEHLMSLRAIPELRVYRPADAVETAECWAAALKDKTHPAVLALTRQGLPTVRTSAGAGTDGAGTGGYVLREAEGDAKVTLLATGSEVEIALGARDLLASDGIAASVVSMPCWELFDLRPKAEREKILGPGTVRVAVEAGAAFGWERYVGTEGGIVAMNSFGASAPIKDLYAHFGITAQAVAAKAKALLADKNG